MNKRSNYPENGLPIKVDYKGKTYKIYLSQELSISESIINQQLKEHPSHYGFILLARSRAIKIRDAINRELEYTRAALYNKYSIQVNPLTEKPYTKEAIDSKIKVNPNYNNLLNKLIEAENNVNDLYAASRAFETREKLLQTISGNIRNER